MAAVPIYSIRDFRQFSQRDAFYASNLKLHVRRHDFTNVPHKHDFFMAALFTKGTGTHEVDFKKYPVKPGSLFLLRPGQMHNWKLSEDCDGYIFFHTRDFFEESFVANRLSDYPFYASTQNPPLILLKGALYHKLRQWFREVTEEYKSEEALKFRKLHALVYLVYTDLLSLYEATEKPALENYLGKLRQFEDLIDQHYKEHLGAKDYAAAMNISEKHLNRICRSTVEKTSTDLIAERLALEAKRLLLASALTAAQVAAELGFEDNSYFNRFFKKRTGFTPLEFRHNYLQNG